MKTHATHICLNSFNYNDDKSNQKNSLLFSTTCFGLKGHHEAETKKNMYMHMCVCICVYTQFIWDRDSFMLVFNLMMIFQVETC